MNAGADTKHFVTMDGLRGIAAIVVAIYHRRFWFGEGYWHGYLAVDFFFLLSGFVIAHAYGTRLAENRMSVKDFVIARVIRLYPMIVLGAALGTLAVLIQGFEAHWFGLVARGVAAFPLAAIALPQPFLSEPFFPNAPVWSLFFEIIANLAYVMFLPRLPTRWIAVITGILAIGLALAIRAHGQVNSGWLVPTMPIGLLRVGFPFTAGILMQRRHAAGVLHIPALPVWILGTLLVGILCIPVMPSWQGEIFFTLAAIFVVFPLMVASASHDQPSRFWTRVSKLSATISYPLYLLHWPIFMLADRVPGFDALPVPVRLAIVIPLSIALSLLAVSLYDAPVRKWISARVPSRRRANFRPDPVSAAVPL